MGALLRDRSFRLLWSAQVTSSFGDALTSLTLLLLVQRLTGSPAAVAGTAIAVALPQLLIGLVAGALVDRWSRRRVMIVSDLVRAVLVLGFLTATTVDRLWILYAIAFAQAAVGTFFSPARATLLAEVLPAESLLPANSLSDMSRVVAGVAGVAAAGALAGAGVSLDIVFVVDSLTFVASAALIGFIREDVASRRDRQRARILSEVATGLRMLLGSRLLIGVVAAGTVAMFGLGAVNVLLVPFVVRDLGASETWFGALEGAQVTAMVAAGALVAAFAARLSPPRLIGGAALGLGAIVAAIAACTAPWQLLILLFTAGWFVTPLQASVTTLLQTNVPPQLRGRTQAAFATLVSGASLASMSLGGATAAITGVRPVLALAGLLVAAAGLASHAAFRRIPAVHPAATVEVS